MNKTPSPPSHLTPHTAVWWRSVVADYELEQHHVRLLTAAAEAWDRAQAARAAIDANGLTFTDRFDQPRSRPEVRIEQQSVALFARLIRELGLDLESPTESRPPRTQPRR